MANPEQEAQALWNELLRAISKLVAEYLATFRPNLAQSTGVLPGQQLPQATTSSPGAVQIDGTSIISTDGVISAPAGGFVDPMTATGDIIYRDSGGNPAALPVGTLGQVLTVVTGGVPDYADPTGSSDPPQHVTCWHDESVITTGSGTLSTNSTDGGQRYQTYSAISPAANGDAFTQMVVLDAGNYRFSVLGYTDTDQGQVTWTLGAQVLAAAQDWYSGGGTYNVAQTVSFTLAAAGRYALTGTISGKNGSSSGYVLRLTKFWVSPA